MDIEKWAIPPTMWTQFQERKMKNLITAVIALIAMFATVTTIAAEDKKSEGWSLNRQQAERVKKCMEQKPDDGLEYKVGEVGEMLGIVYDLTKMSVTERMESGDGSVKIVGSVPTENGDSCGVTVIIHPNTDVEIETSLMSLTIFSVGSYEHQIVVLVSKVREVSLVRVPFTEQEMHRMRHNIVEVYRLGK